MFSEDFEKYKLAINEPGDILISNPNSISY